MSTTPDLEDHQATLSFIEESVAEIDRLTKQAAQLQKENTQLRSEKAALEKNKVILEKVATASPFGTKQIDEIITALKPSQFIQEGDTEKVAEVLRSDPTNVVKLIQKMAYALEHHSSGVPVIRTSETNEHDPDGWGNIGKARRSA
jgi:hypothetical protein